MSKKNFFYRPKLLKSFAGEGLCSSKDRYQKKVMGLETQFTSVCLEVRPLSKVNLKSVSWLLLRGFSHFPKKVSLFFLEGERLKVVADG